MSNQDEKIVDKVEDTLEERVVDSVEELEEKYVEVGDDVTPKKPKKVNSHNELVQRAKQNQESAKAKYDAFLRAEAELNKTSEDFINYENSIVDTTVKTSLELLQKLNVDSLDDAKADILEITNDNKAELLTIKTPSKGSAKGFIIGLIGALATATGALAYGAKLQNLPLNMATFMQKSSLDSIATKYSELINIKNTPIAGYALIGAASLFVGYSLYKLITWLQAKKNVRYISKVESNLEEYAQELDDKIANINDLKTHIEHINLVMQKYDIILQEQNAKIRRMLFIEQPEEGVDSLQNASKLEVEKTVLILDELLSLMNTPVNDGSKISEDSHNRLNSANSVINEVIKKLYV